MEDTRQPVWRFGPFLLDDGRGRLSGPEGEVPLRPKSLDLLVYLVRNAGRVVPKAELMDAVWPDVTVTEDSLTQCISDIRRALGGKGTELLRTVPRRGYVFSEATPDPVAPSGPMAAPDPPSPPLPDRPSIAVLPFANMGADTQDDHFADGITEDVITELSRFRSLSVIARNTSFTFKGRSHDLRDVGRKLGVRYIVEGSLRRTQHRLRLTAQLIDAATGVHIWAERYDRGPADLPEVQDDLVRTLVSTVVGRIEVTGKLKVQQAGGRELRAYDLYLRAAAAQDRNTREDYGRARGWLQQALAEEPMLAQAHHHLSLVAYVEWLAFWPQDREATFAEALASARQSLALDDGNSAALAHFGMLLMHQGHYDEAERQFARALELNPNDARARALHGFFLTAVGRPDAALAAFDLAARIDPFRPAWTSWLKGIACFSARRYAEAITTFRAIAHPMNEVRGWLAASHAMAGETAVAREMLATFLATARTEISPPLAPTIAAWEPFWQAAIPYRDARDFEPLFEGLRRAGMAG